MFIAKVQAMKEPQDVIPGLVSLQCADHISGARVNLFRFINYGTFEFVGIIPDWEIASRTGFPILNCESAHHVIQSRPHIVDSVASDGIHLIGDSAGIEDSQFKDDLHLAPAGAVLFSKHLAELLR